MVISQLIQANFFHSPSTYYYVDPNQYSKCNNIFDDQGVNSFEMQNFFVYNIWQNQYNPVLCSNMSLSN